MLIFVQADLFACIIIIIINHYYYYYDFIFITCIIVVIVIMCVCELVMHNMYYVNSVIISLSFSAPC